MARSYNEILNAEQKQECERIFAVKGMHSVRFYHLRTQEEFDAYWEEAMRRHNRRDLKDVERASSPYSKGYIQADCDIFYDVPGKGRSAVFVDDHGDGYTVDNLPKDFDPKSCLFSFKYDEQTGKICSAITVEHYNDKGTCDSAWFLDKDVSGKYEAYSFSNKALASITYDRNRARMFGEHSAPGKWPEFKVESKEEIDAWRQSMMITMPISDFKRLDGLNAKLAHAEAKLEGRKPERDVSLAELAVQAEEARTHQSKSNHSEQAVDAGDRKLAELLLKGDLEAAKQLAEKIVKPESQDKAAGKKRTDMQEARSASGCKEQKVQEALTRCNKALGKGTASLQGERQEPQQEEKNEKGFAGKLKSMLLRKLKGNSGH